MKPDEVSIKGQQNSEQQPVTASIAAVFTCPVLRECQDFCATRTMVG
jgi:hypothetical protein